MYKFKIEVIDLDIDETVVTDWTTLEAEDITEHGECERVGITVSSVLRNVRRDYAQKQIEMED